MQFKLRTKPLRLELYLPTMVVPIKQQKKRLISFWNGLTMMIFSSNILEKHHLTTLQFKIGQGFLESLDSKTVWFQVIAKILRRENNIKNIDE